MSVCTAYNRVETKLSFPIFWKMLNFILFDEFSKILYLQQCSFSGKLPHLFYFRENFGIIHCIPSVVAII
jgi:hypothetical protein